MKYMQGLSIDKTVMQEIEERNQALKTAVFEALGTASVCWHDDGEFNSVLAEKVGNELIQKINDLEVAHLGLATTGQLISELAARAEIGGYVDYTPFEKR